MQPHDCRISPSRSEENVRTEFRRLDRPHDEILHESVACSARLHETGLVDLVGRRQILDGAIAHERTAFRRRERIARDAAHFVRAYQNCARTIGHVFGDAAGDIRRKPAAERRRLAGIAAVGVSEDAIVEPCGRTAVLAEHRSAVSVENVALENDIPEKELVSPSAPGAEFYAAGL